ncbi:MobV family relaxase [Massilia agri]|uniref:Plasmid recombination protein n=1 Tax=Massilia agri TaxID=1886785 RepID=A0ABT2APH1_9BURK|nr:MobV family relaxase [Massilia agri]MCS0597633.1 plasmid recombination protein [Massilia agri]
MYTNVDIKKFGDLQAANAAGHNLRQIPSDNVNTKKTKLNTYYVGDPDMDFNAVLSEKLKKFKVRKNGVKTVNLVFSASPELFENKTKAAEWEKLTWEFIEKTFGKENIVYAVVHKDETTPHFQVSVIPVNPKGKISATHFFDGRKKCGEFTTAYNKAVKHLGLKRDKGNKKAKPADIRDFYNKVLEAKGYDKKTDNAIDNFDKTIKDESTFGFIKVSTAMKLFQPFWDVLKRYKAQRLSDATKVAEAEKNAQELEDLKLKFDNLGLSPDIEFSKCLEVRELIELGRTAKAENEAKASKDGALQLDQEPIVSTKSKKSLPIPGRKRKTTGEDSDAK